MSVGGGPLKTSSRSISSLCVNGTPSVNKSSQPRLLYLASTISHGGIERHSVELADALQARGILIWFACPAGSYLQSACRARGVSTLPFRVRNSGDLGAAFRLATLLEAQQIDIVHAHSRRDYVIAALGTALARRRLRSFFPRLILHAHMIRPLGSPARLSGRFFEWGADAVVGVSGIVCDHLRHDHQFHPAFVHLIYNGVRLEEFARPGSSKAAAQRQEARQRWGIAEDARVLGMIGRLDAKGQKKLLEVFPALAARHPDLQIALIGAEGAKGESLRLTAQARAGGFADRLRLIGPREDVPALLPALDTLVHLPRDEAFGLALAEAMAAGLPTVATDIGGCREVVRDGLTGLLTPPDAPQALTEALLFLMDPAAGAARRAAFGAAGRRIAEADFSRARQVQRLLSLYHSLCPALTV